MNKYILVGVSYFALISLIIFSVFIDSQYSGIKTDVPLKTKELTKLNSKNLYFKAKGINTTFNGFNVNIKKENIVYIIKPKNKFINPFFLVEVDSNIPNNNLLSDSITLVKFNNYNESSFLKYPLINKEFIELSKNRFVSLYRSVSKTRFELINGEGPSYIDITNVKIDSNSHQILSDIFKLGLYPNSNNAYFLSFNPLDKNYKIYPDLSKFSRNKNPKFFFKYALDTINQNETYETLTITKDTVFSKNLKFKNVKLIVKPNVQITLNNNASLLFENSLIFSNSIDSNTRWISKDHNALIFKDCDSISINKNSFIGFSNINKLEFDLPSAITFYNSYLTIKNSSFSSNVSGDDNVNIFKSRFYISDTKFSDSQSDALDIDFSEGVIKNSLFMNIQNDGIDISGSIITLENNEIYDCGDKAISIGENSEVILNNNIIKNSELGVVCKDGSKCFLNSNILESNRLSFSAFNKKKFYSKPVLFLDDYINNYSYLVEENTIGNSKDSIIKVILSNNVKKLMYGNVYGKKSK